MRTVTSESVFTIATCGMSTESYFKHGFPIVCAQEYDVRDLSAQRSSLEVCRCCDRKVESCIGSLFIVESVYSIPYCRSLFVDIYR